jgi:hypothetical protein
VATGAHFGWLFSCRRMRCITAMIFRDFVSTIATSSSTAR